MGYFFAIDISFFSLFNIAEHTVFAFRAIPFAIIGSVMFVIFYSFAQQEKEHAWSQITQRIFLYFLIALAIACFWDFRFVVSLSLFAEAFAVRLYIGGEMPKGKIIHVMYFASSIMFVTFFAGYVSGFTALYLNLEPLVIYRSDGQTNRGVSLLVSGKKFLIINESETAFNDPFCHKNSPTGPVAIRLRLLEELRKALRGRHVRVLEWTDVKEVGPLCAGHD